MRTPFAPIVMAGWYHPHPKLSPQMNCPIATVWTDIRRGHVPPLFLKKCIKSFGYVDKSVFKECIPC